MRVLDTTNNVNKNEAHYDHSYSDVNIQAIVSKISNFDAFFDDAVRTDTSWHGFYLNGFADRLAGKRVLELGCGDGVNALAMAQLGAEVVAVDISSALSARLQSKLIRCAIVSPHWRVTSPRCHSSRNPLILSWAKHFCII